ncbi:PTS sugar transporter subunit IIA [Anaerosalibacter massiliensis]|uniref:Mannitol-specific phosphotransferase enzyme IIA component n=1 Tax=Anaerosalibacter massiliensis TaxID=1347392 RepID=A0A9X2MGI3_9FIRM|nr:PTS sugar transporter subunit IIA [Anaerosalibacter massiliensis]MCR2043254.1 PTS sugar transporter subunit IIA [Anaerosalibacter massiliensis]
MLIEKNIVSFDLPSMSKEEAIQLSGEKLVELGLVSEPYIQGMLEKEKTDITYIGNGVAIPHGTNESKKFVKESGIVILHFRKGIEYNSEKVFLVIGIAGAEGDHLSILSDIAIKLSNEQTVKKLIEAPDVESFVQIFNE